MSWMPKKTHSRISPCAQSPRKSRLDCHIPSVATKQLKWKTKNRFSHFPLPRVGSSDQIQKGGLAAELRSSSRLIVRLENAPTRRNIQFSTFRSICNSRTCFTRDLRYRQLLDGLAGSDSCTT